MFEFFTLTLNIRMIELLHRGMEVLHNIVVDWSFGFDDNWEKYFCL